MQITEILGLSAAERQTAKLAAKGEQYHKNFVDSYYAQWIYRLKDGTFTPDAAGFEKYKQMLVKDYKPKNSSLSTTSDPVKFDNKTIYRWTDQAIREKNAMTSSQPKKQPEDQQSTQATSQSSVQPTAQSDQTQAAEPAAPSQPAASQEIELPGTNYKFKYSPSWLDAAGKPASDAVAKILNQLAAGKTGADLDRNEIRDARRSMGLPESRKSKGTIL
jgi:hypothetical protein